MKPKRLTQLQKTITVKCNQAITTAPTPPTIVADTGATGHFFSNEMQEHNDAGAAYINVNLPLTNIRPTNNGIEVLLPNSARMRSTHTALLDIQGLPQQAKTTHIFPNLASGSLLSIGQLCDAGCTALFDKKKLYIFNKGKIIMQGTRQKSKLWTIDNTAHHSLNSVIDAPTIAERIEFFSRSLFSPTLPTLTKAISAGYLSSFPEVTTKQLRR